MKFINVLFTFLFFAIGLNTVGQDCKDYKLNKCDGYGSPYKYSGQSKSAFFEKGQKSVFYISAYGGFEYSVRICADKNLSDLYFLIREDNVDRSILYDSSTEVVNYLEKQFFCEQTKKFIIEVVVPESDDPESEKYDDRNGCIGVLIEYYKAPPKGF